MEKNKQTPYQRVPPAEMASRVTAAVWLELGPKERSEISRKRLVSECYRVAAVRPEILEKIQQTLQRIQPQKAEQFKTLMSNPHMMRIAMDSVSGSERLVTEKSAIDAMDTLTNSLIAVERGVAEKNRR
jgi:hypothetical protein